MWYCVKRREVEVLQILSILHNHRFELLQNINGMNWGQDITEICLRLLINSRGPFCTVTTRTALRILSFSLQYLSSSKLLNDSPINVNDDADDAWLPSLLLECLGHLTLGTGALGERDGICSGGGSGPGKEIPQKFINSDVKFSIMLADTIRRSFGIFSVSVDDGELTSESESLIQQMKNKMNDNEVSHGDNENFVIEDNLLWDTSKIERERKNDIQEVVDKVSSEFKSWNSDPRHSVILDQKKPKKEPEVWKVVIASINVRRGPNMDKEPIGRRHRGDKVKIIEERSADSQGFPGAKWLKFERPIGGHPESWVLSRNTERVLMRERKATIVRGQ